MKTNQSVLDTIKHAVENLNWESETKKQKALNLCISIFNLYIYEGGDFNTYKELSKDYFLSIIKTMNYVYPIKNNLVDNGILEIYVNNQGKETYDVKGKGKGYRFNQSLIKGLYVVLSGTKQEVLSSTKSNFQGQINISTNLNILTNQPYHICGTKLETSIKSTLNKITINPEIDNYINNFSIKRNDIKVNNEIEDKYVKIVYDNKTYRYKLENALKQAEENGLELIQYKNKCYIDSIELFLIRKTNDLRLIYRKSKFDLENKLFRISRNDTNRRLDYNLTNMKSNLIEYLLLDNEELIELDIANAQFSILSFITKDLDETFIEETQTGKLYSNISKLEWFRVAFDKIKKEHDNIRNLYPSTMNFIDKYKKENGYKSFSNLLQNVESLIMIDGLLNKLIDKNYEVLPIHDAIRVKKSQVNEIKKIIEEYFNEIDFKCLLRVKNKKDKESIIEDKIIKPEEDMRVIEYNYKGFENIILTLTKKDKQDFRSAIKRLNENGYEICLSTLELCGLNKYKLEYLYNIWYKKNKLLNEGS